MLQISFLKWQQNVFLCQFQSQIRISVISYWPGEDVVSMLMSEPEPKDLGDGPRAWTV